MFQVVLTSQTSQGSNKKACRGSSEVAQEGLDSGQLRMFCRSCARLVIATRRGTSQAPAYVVSPYASL